MNTIAIVLKRAKRQALRLYYILRYRRTNRPNLCQRQGCCDQGIECRLYAFDDDGNVSEAFEYFCADHCHEHGYCFICGLFWSGFESFDFPKWHKVIEGMCEPCSEETKYDAGELDGQYEDDYVYDPYDFVMP